MSAFQEYFLDTLKHRYADFSGRASRSEYWYFVLFSMLSFFALMMVSMPLSFIGSSDFPILSIGVLGLFGLGIFIPSIAVTIRRLHDVGHSGWWYLLSLIPLLSIVIFIFTLLESQAGKNKWGPNPWEVDSDDAYYNDSNMVDDF